MSTSKQARPVESLFRKGSQSEAARANKTQTHDQSQVKGQPQSKKNVGKKKPAPTLNTRSQADIDEDNEIAWLEYQLGLTGSKSKGKKSGYRRLLEEEGLDGTF
jgi:hypothetical protein